MKKFTRLASIALCLTLAVLALAACGKKDDTDTDPDAPAVTQMTKANIGVYQHLAGEDNAKLTILDTADVVAGTTITIKAEETATNVLIDLRTFLTGKLGANFSFTRTDRKDGDGKLIKLFAYQVLPVESAEQTVAKYVKYGDDKTDAAKHLTELPAGSLRCDMDATFAGETTDTTGFVDGLYFAPNITDDATTETVTEQGYNQTVEFVFTAQDGKQYKLNVKIENKPAATNE